MCVVDSSNHVTFQLPYLQVVKLLKRRGRSFSGYGREPDTMIFELQGSQYKVYEWLQPIGTWVTQDALQKIVDALLTLIFSMGQGA
jgi:hypothetical protein